MRIKLGDSICECTLAHHSEESKIIVVKTSKGIYNIAAPTIEQANDMFLHLLIHGYLDTTGCKWEG